MSGNADCNLRGQKMSGDGVGGVRLGTALQAELLAAGLHTCLERYLA